MNDFQSWVQNVRQALDDNNHFDWHVNARQAEILIETVIKACPNLIQVELTGHAALSSNAYAANPAHGITSWTRTAVGCLENPDVAQGYYTGGDGGGGPVVVPPDVEGYERLDDVLTRAYDQAARGKGAERHANGKPFHEQPMQTIAQQVGVGFITGQAMKKLGESAALPRDRAIRELLGAIVYAAGAVIFLESQPDDPEAPK